MLRVIVSFGREPYEFKRFREQGERAVDERVKLTVRQTMFTLLVNTITAAGTAFVLGYGFYLVLEGQLEIGKLIVLMSYVAAVYQPLEQVSGSVGLLHTELVALRGSFQLLDTAPEVVEDPHAVAIERARGEVDVRERELQLPGAQGHAARDQLRGPPGSADRDRRADRRRQDDADQPARALLRPARRPDLLDGIDVRKLKLHSLRDQISLVLQEPLLFSGTVAENIRYGRLDATMDDVIEAARSAGAHDFIERLPQGYETELGERGAQLSGGERQRICVARAFIKDAPILILDEPTSSIDSKTEAIILDSLERLMAGRTSFMIAHRLSTIRHADKIVVHRPRARRRAGNARGAARARRPLPAAARRADAPAAALVPRRRRPRSVGAGEATSDRADARRSSCSG